MFHVQREGLPSEIQIGFLVISRTFKSIQVNGPSGKWNLDRKDSSLWPSPENIHFSESDTVGHSGTLDTLDILWYANQINEEQITNKGERRLNSVWSQNPIGNMTLNCGNCIIEKKKNIGVLSPCLFVTESCAPLLQCLNCIPIYFSQLIGFTYLMIYYFIYDLNIDYLLP